MLQLIYHRTRAVYLQFVGSKTLTWTPDKSLAKRFSSSRDALELADKLELVNFAVVPEHSGASMKELLKT